VVEAHQRPDSKEREVQPSDVKPGDVLLFHGKSFVGWAIRAVDGTTVNHAAVALPGGMLAEAGGRGLQKRAIPLPGGGEFILVRRLDGSAALDPVVARATVLLDEGHLYAYQQIVLLAVLCLTRRVPLPRLARRLVRSALDHAAKAVMDLLPVGASWMICSEYVWRSFHEALEGDADAFELQLAGISFGDDGGETLLDWSIANAAEIEIRPPVAFGGVEPPADPTMRVAAIEADLAPLVADYAASLYAEGVISEQDLPPILDPSFGPAPELPPQPTDEELLSSIATFAINYTAAQGQMPVADPSFGAVGSAIAAAALKGALQGLKKIEVEGNFVTPGDLLKTPSLTEVGQLG
jgi:hypothetical protein